MEASNLPAQAPAGLDEARITVRGVGLPGAPGGAARGSRGRGVRARQPRLRRGLERPGASRPAASRARWRPTCRGSAAPTSRATSRTPSPAMPTSSTGCWRSSGIDRVHLVLHDFGGPWGMEWAARNPDRVASVVLINTGALSATAGTSSRGSGARPCWARCSRRTATRPLFRLLTNRGQKRKLPRELPRPRVRRELHAPHAPRGAEALPGDPRSRRGRRAARPRRCARTTSRRWSCGARATRTSGVELRRGTAGRFSARAGRRARGLRPLALRRRPRADAAQRRDPVPARAGHLHPSTKGDPS